MISRKGWVQFGGVNAIFFAGCLSQWAVDGHRDWGFHFLSVLAVLFGRWLVDKGYSR